MAWRGRAIGGHRTKWILLAVWTVLVGVFGPLGLKLPDVTNDEVVVPSGSQTAQASRLLRDRFPGGDRKYVLLVYRRAGGLTAADRARIAADARRARSVPLVEEAVTGFVARKGDVAFTVGVLESRDVFRVTPTIDDLRQLEDDEPSGLELHVTGSPALLSDFNGAVKEADVKLLLATGALVLLLLLAVYRSPILALLPLTVVALAYSVASGVIYLLAKGGLPVDSTSTSLLLVLMFGAGTDYCLLLVARYRGQLQAAVDPDTAIARALPTAAPAMIASAATVITAMLAMLAGILGLNRTLGPVNAIGIGIVLFASLTLLPALLAVAGRRAFWPGRPGDGGGESAFWQRLGGRVQARPLPWLAGIVLLLGAGAGGLSIYKEHADWFKQFRTATDGTRGYDVLKSRFPAGTLAPTTVVVDSTAPLRPADVALVRSRLAATPGVASVTGVLRRSRDGRAAELRLTLTGDPYAAAARQTIGRARREATALRPGLEVLFAEGAARQVDFKAAAGRDANVIAPLVLAVVLITLVILLRALVAPLYLLGTVILSYLATLGVSLLAFRYLFGQDLVDPELRLIVFIFLVALGSDYNIFLMSRVREEAQRHGTREGMLRALVATGPVITSAGLILAGTFSVLMVLPIWELLEIGFAVALGVLVDTFLVRSILVPAIAWLVGDRSWWPSRAESAAPVAGAAPES